jgi:hypothetical protein
MSEIIENNYTTAERNVWSNKNRDVMNKLIFHCTIDDQSLLLS